MSMLVNVKATLPKPEGAPPFVISSDISIKVAYPVSRDFADATMNIEPLGQRTADSIQAFFKPEWQYGVFEKDWLYAICESGISRGYHVTNHERGLRSHPFAPIGLAPKNVFEVVNSSWITDLQVSSSVPSTQLLKHYIFAFDDVVFECAATHFGAEYVFGGRYEVSSYVAASTKWGQ